MVDKKQECINLKDQLGGAKKILFKIDSVLDGATELDMLVATQKNALRIYIKSMRLIIGRYGYPKTIRT